MSENIPIDPAMARKVYRLTLDLADQLDTLGEPDEAAYHCRRAEIWRQMVLDHGGPDVAEAMRVYKIQIWPDTSGGYVVDIPELPGCISQGNTINEALINIAEALVGVVEAREDWGVA